MGNIEYDWINLMDYQGGLRFNMLSAAAYFIS